VTGYISIGDLALELGTSCQKLGKLIKHNNIETKSRYNREKTSYSKTVTMDASKTIKELLPNFNMEKHSRIKLKKEDVKTKKVKRKEYSDEQFVNPIVGRYWGNGNDERWGQGIRAYWARERLR
jgi:hypothetical protein